jgi:hypothetical protein
MLGVRIELDASNLLHRANLGGQDCGHGIPALVDQPWVDVGAHDTEPINAPWSLAQTPVPEVEAQEVDVRPIQQVPGPVRADWA